MKYIKKTTMFDRFVVTNEIARGLKEVGFDMPCNGAYNDNEDYFTCKVYSQNSGKGLLAPTYEEAFDWFLEIHGYYPVIVPYIHVARNETKWWAKYGIVTKPLARIEISYHDTYPEAKYAVLKSLIEKIKKK